MDEMVALIAIDHDSELYVIDIDPEDVNKVKENYDSVSFKNIIFSSYFFSSVRAVDQKELNETMEVINFMNEL